MASHRCDDVADCCFLDCAVSFALDEPTNEFNNLWHLEGETVAGLIDGMVARDLVVTDGKITLPDNYGTVSKATFGRSEEHTSELQSLMRISYAVFCLKKKKKYSIKQEDRQTNND